MITDYATLQTEIAEFAYRDDLTAKIPTFIQLCEADMQVRCKLVDLESNASIVLTAGVGPLPTGYTGARSVWYDGDQVRELKYITPNQLTAYDSLAGLPTYYTIIGTDIHVIPSATGTVKMTYKARFTALSSTDTTNAILLKYPDAYLYGSLVQLIKLQSSQPGTLMKLQSSGSKWMTQSGVTAALRCRYGQDDAHSRLCS